MMGLIGRNAIEGHAAELAASHAVQFPIPDQALDRAAREAQQPGGIGD
jgi:hypothetical protein